MNELMQMKNQMSQMMQTIKQKDELINQQNVKLSQVTSQYGVMNNSQGMNNMQAMNNLSMPGMNNMPQMNNIQGMNNMNSMSNVNFLNGQQNPSANPSNNNAGFQYNNFPQFKSNDAPNPSYQLPQNNNSGRRISPFLSMNLNKPF
jgi:hypothetical protein